MAQRQLLGLVGVEPLQDLSKATVKAAPGAMGGGGFYFMLRRWRMVLSWRGYIFSVGRLLEVSFPFFRCSFHFRTRGVRSSM